MYCNLKILLKYNFLSSQIDSFTKSPSYRHKLSTKSPRLKENIIVYNFFFFNRRRGGTRGRSRSRSRDRGDGFRGRKSEIDKEKLLAIAKKNAVRLLSSDNLMGMDHDRLIAIKSGGQNLRQLTDFCREIVAKGIFFIILT